MESLASNSNNVTTRDHDKTTHILDIDEFKTVGDISHYWAKKDPERVACDFEGYVQTYSDLERRSSLVASGLQQCGLSKGSRVAVLDLNSNYYLEVLLGAAKSGCVLVGINARLVAPEIEYILSDSEAELVFVGEAHANLIAPIVAKLGIKHLFVFNGEGHLSYEEWLLSQKLSLALPEVSSSDDFLQLYTSGTTGFPKGVVHSHRGWFAYATAARSAPWRNYGKDTVSLVCMPFFHVAGINFCLLTLFSGGLAVITRGVNPDEIARLLPEKRVSDTILVPSVINGLLDYKGVEAWDFSNLKTIMYGGAPMPVDVLKRAMKVFRCDFVQAYGFTEALGAVTQMSPEMHRSVDYRYGSCGIPYNGLDLRIVRNDGADCDVDEVGEIIVRCEWMMGRYWKNSAATAETIRDGWLYSGDAGCRDKDGFIFIRDRVKDMVVSGGENVYPAEVENALIGHPAVLEAVVVGVPDSKWGEAVSAVVVLNSGVEVSVQELGQYVRSRLAGYKCPKDIRFVDSIPKNAAGKALRRLVRSMLVDEKILD